MRNALRNSAASALALCLSSCVAAAETAPGDRTGASPAPAPMEKIEPIRQFEVTAEHGERAGERRGADLVFLPEPHTEFVFTVDPSLGLDRLFPTGEAETDGD